MAVNKFHFKDEHLGLKEAKRLVRGPAAGKGTPRSMLSVSVSPCVGAPSVRGSPSSVASAQGTTAFDLKLHKSRRSLPHLRRILQEEAPVPLLTTASPSGHYKFYILEVWGQEAGAQDGGVLGYQIVGRLRKAAGSEVGRPRREAPQCPGVVASAGQREGVWPFCGLDHAFLETSVSQTSVIIMQSP